jgi:hypothetical protein
MAQDWDTSGAAEPGTGTNAGAALLDLIDGVNAARTCYYGTTDPSSGASWGADQLGTIWIDSTNSIEAAGDDLYPVIKIWSVLTDTPTYGWRTLGARRYIAVEPNTNSLDLSNSTDVAFTELDVSGDSSAQAIAVLLQVTATEDAPGASYYASFRKSGTTGDAQERRVYPQVAGIPVCQQILVEVDAGVLEYAIAASGADTFDLRIDLLGYYERAG